MDTLTFISKLVEAFVWPVATVIICVLLKSPISSLLARLNKAKHKDTEFNFDADAQKAPASISVSTHIADAIPHDQLGLIKEAEERIYKSLEELNINNDSEKVKVLAKHHANLQIRSAYSEMYHVIFGSQLLLLQSLNVQSKPVEPQFLVTFYESAKYQYPEFYKTYTFENYINFLKSVGLINTENGNYFITVLGRGFLTYLAETGRNLNRNF